MDQSSPGADERWLPVVGYEGLYEVSDLGRVRRLWRKGPKPLKQNLKPEYLGIILWRNGEGWTVLVHILVARAFLGPRPEGHQVCHGPAGKLDNRLVNLSYGTASKNHGADMHRDGTIQMGVRHVRAKLTDEIVRECRRRAAAGEAKAALAREFGVHNRTMRDAVTGVHWKHVA